MKHRNSIGPCCQGIGGWLTLSALVIFLASPIWPLHAPVRPRVRTYCINNLKVVGLAFKTWGLDHSGDYPFNVSTNQGGVRECCAVGADGFASNSVPIFKVMSNELSTPIFLACPQDNSHTVATNFSSLRPANVTYQVQLGTNNNEENPSPVLVVCPIHGNVLRWDGSVQTGTRVPPGSGRPHISIESLAFLYAFFAIVFGPILLIVGVVVEVVSRRTVAAGGE